MPFALIRGAEIGYEIVGAVGPWAVVMPIAREPMAAVAGLARTIASAGYRVLLHDRRNCGRSSLDLATAAGEEEEIWADDLAALLDHLGIGSAM